MNKPNSVKLAMGMAVLVLVLNNMPFGESQRWLIPSRESAVTLITRNADASGIRDATGSKVNQQQINRRAVPIRWS